VLQLENPWYETCSMLALNVGASFRHVRKIAKKLRYVCPSVRPHVTTRLPQEGFSWILRLSDRASV